VTTRLQLIIFRKAGVLKFATVALSSRLFHGLVYMNMQALIRRERHDNSLQVKNLERHAVSEIYVSSGLGNGL